MGIKKFIELVEFLKQPRYEKYLSIPPVPSVGMRVFVGTKKIYKSKADEKYAAAFQNKSYRMGLQEKYWSLKNKSPENDPIEKTIYYYFPFTKIKNLKDDEKEQLEEWSTAFCQLLDIVKPMEIIIDGAKTRNFLVNEIFEDIAKKIWELDDAFDGKILRTHLKTIEPNCQLVGLPLYRPLSEIEKLENIIDEMGHAIADVHDIFEFVENEVNDEAEAYFDNVTYFDGETLADKLEVQYSLHRLWEQIKEIKYRLTENKEISKTDELILNASIFDDIIDFFDFKKDLIELKETKYHLIENKKISKTDKLILDADKIDDIIESFDVKKELKELIYRLKEDNKNGNDISKNDKLVLNADIIDDIIDFFDFKKGDNSIDENTMPCTKVNAIIECVKRLRILDYETKKGKFKSVCDNAILFYILLEWALNGKSPDEIFLKLSIKVNYESSKPKDDMTIGNDGDTILSHVYEYFVTNKTIRNAHNANQMKKLFTKDKKTLWKPKKILDEVPYTHVSWHPYIDKSWKKN